MRALCYVEFALLFGAGLAGCETGARSGSYSAPTTIEAVRRAAADGDLLGRLHNVIFVRNDRDGKEIGADDLDPLVWPDSKYLLAEPRYGQFMALLNELTAADVGKMASADRAIVQHDLWTIFDWTDHPRYRNPDSQEFASVQREHSEALRQALVPAIRHLALSADEIASLPDNYANTIASHRFASVYDDAEPQKPFLPSDLFDPKGPWVCIGTPHREPGIVARAHARHFSGRAAFLIFLNLPAGRQATLDYLKKLALFPRPWQLVKDPIGKVGSTDRLERGDPIQLSSDVHEVPVGTKVALVRQMLVLDEKGQPAITPVVESIQLRVFRKIAAADVFIGGDRAREYQSFIEFVLERPSELRPIREDELAYITVQFITGSEDFFEHPDKHNRLSPILKTCASCHVSGGVRSLNSFVSQFSPADLNPHFTPIEAKDEIQRAISWKRQQHDLGLLQGLLERAKTK